MSFSARGSLAKHAGKPPALQTFGTKSYALNHQAIRELSSLATIRYFLMPYLFVCFFRFARIVCNSPTEKNKPANNPITPPTMTRVIVITSDVTNPSRDCRLDGEIATTIAPTHPNPIAPKITHHLRTCHTALISSLEINRHFLVFKIIGLHHSKNEIRILTFLYRKVYQETRRRIPCRNLNTPPAFLPQSL